MPQDASRTPFTQIGIIARSHGLKGEVKALFETGKTELIKQLEMVYLRTERGDFFPVRVKTIRTEEKANALSFFVQFEHIADRTSAEALKNHGIFLETQKALAYLKEAASDDPLMDYEIIDEQNQSIGRVIEVMDNSVHLILIIATTRGKLLIPFVDEFVVNVDDENESVTCKNLDLLEGI